MHREILIRFDRCLGCLSCEIACAIAHAEEQTLLGAITQPKPPQKRIYVEQVESRKAPVTCRHCQEAYCIDACIAGAMHRTEEGVVTNLGREQKCIGCWMCVMVCPYGVIRRDGEQRIALKCDRQCLDDQKVPACVRACPTKALVFTTVEEFEAEKRHQYLASLT
ncbi:4Fe-4S ferredoxin-type, iron-sulphur binding domain [Moorella glycerini]|uniref:Iron-sulfur protein n=1 Tax=Neomoorella stamsii TaxID=1266720 RepID=A0A9X7P4U4_9FIRM|nr:MULTISPECIES: 4Fe-4S dicluster domain-containing protein [Moorella]PRR68921.1 Iron-sulfur protein [Moorella stamsii]CEP67542.1 4Fe-4S ferredoxin-type, iron-sulphur binding domain [Moorella glycerini]